MRFILADSIQPEWRRCGAVSVAETISLVRWHFPAGQVDADAFRCHHPHDSKVPECLIHALLTRPVSHHMQILITAGPTREYIDDVRFLSNASSGRMGYSLAAAAVARGHQVQLVTGPVELQPPEGCKVHRIETTDQLRKRCLELFPECDGVIATAAVCDYRPKERIVGKITKTGHPIVLELTETSDVLAELGGQKGHRWVVGFALESQDPRNNAMRKLRMKNCNCIVLNDTSAIGSLTNAVEVLSPDAQTIASFKGTKDEVAGQLLGMIETIVSGPVSN